MTIIDDILDQIKHTEKRLKRDEDMESTLEHDQFEKQTTSGVNSNGGYHSQVQETDETKVIPLYTPEEAILNVFMVHGSQKSALALAPFALGFQQQVRYRAFACNVMKILKA